MEYISRSILLLIYSTFNVKPTQPILGKKSKNEIISIQMRFDTRLYKISSILSILTLIGTIMAIGIIFKLFYKIVNDLEFT